MPRANLLWLAALLALLVQVGQAPRLIARLELLWREPLQLAAHGDFALALSVAQSQLRSLVVVLALCLSAVFALVLLLSWLVQGPAYAQQRARFEALRVDRTAGVLWALMTLGLMGFVLWDARKLELDTSWMWALALLSVACLVVDVAFARARWLQSLWMTRREFLDAQREQGVSPARTRLRGLR